ncbi:MAG: hypothetical protein AAFO98_11365, partial [Pseudomonadota bacterium]
RNDPFQAHKQSKQPSKHFAASGTLGSQPNSEAAHHLTFSQINSLELAALSCLSPCLRVSAAAARFPVIRCKREIATLSNSQIAGRSGLLQLQLLLTQHLLGLAARLHVPRGMRRQNGHSAF